MPADTTDAKAKLCNLELHMPGEPSHLYAFAKMIGERIPNPAEPSAVVMTEQYVLYEIQENSVSLPARLRGQPTIAIASLAMCLPSLVRLVFSPDFAAEVLAFRELADEAARG